MTESRLHISTFAVVGVGLIGGSLALALKGAGVVGTVLGFDHDRRNLEKALELGVIDAIAESPADLATADVIFLATPVLAMTAAAAEILPFLKPGAILTDGGSVKGEVVAAI